MEYTPEASDLEQRHLGEVFSSHDRGRFPEAAFDDLHPLGSTDGFSESRQMHSLFFRPWVPRLTTGSSQMVLQFLPTAIDNMRRASGVWHLNDRCYLMLLSVYGVTYLCIHIGYIHIYKYKYEYIYTYIYNIDIHIYIYIIHIYMYIIMHTHIYIYNNTHTYI